MIFELSPGSRQPDREAWTMAKFNYERAIALGYAIDKSSNLTYTSALNSYINFCTLHGFSIEPTEDTMSFCRASATSSNPPFRTSVTSGNLR